MEGGESIKEKVQSNFDKRRMNLNLIGQRGQTDIAPKRCIQRSFENHYRVGKVLGKGGFGTVYAGLRVDDGLHVAIKHVAKSKIVEWDLVSKQF